MNEPINPGAQAKNLIVTLRAGGIFFAVANVICVAIICWAYLSVKLEPKTLSVTGSARKIIESDQVRWTGQMMVKNQSLNMAFDMIKKNADMVVMYLKENGISEADITLSAISTSRRYRQDIIYPPASSAATSPTVITTDTVEMYTLSQMISIDSNEVIKVPKVVRSITDLIKNGVEIDTASPSFLYTKLSELKIDMLAEATKDATARATQIVNNANGRLGKLVEARMGVMQINPKGISATSGEGINDTTSYEKEISAVVSVRFEVY